MTLKLKLLVKVAKKRLKEGMTIDEILDNWPNLTDSEKDEIRKAVES